MSVSTPVGQPSIDEIIGSSLRDALSVTKTNRVPAIIAIALATLAAIAATFAGHHSQAPASAMGVCDLMLCIVNYFAIAAAVRTVHPEFRMTWRWFLGFFGYALLVAILTEISAFFLFVPAIWIGVKLALTPYTYLMTQGAPAALKTTWDMTTGYYWETLGLLLVCSIVVCLLMVVPVGVAVAGAVYVPFSIVVLAPAAIAVVVWLVHFQALVYVRWTAALLPRVTVPQTLSTPATM